MGQNKELTYETVTPAVRDRMRRMVILVAFDLKHRQIYHIVVCPLIIPIKRVIWTVSRLWVKDDLTPLLWLLIFPVL